jgi:hypothetical protein
LFENAHFQQLFINFPKYNFSSLNLAIFELLSAKDAENYIQTQLVLSLASYFEDECSFL